MRTDGKDAFSGQFASPLTAVECRPRRDEIVPRRLSVLFAPLSDLSRPAAQVHTPDKGKCIAKCPTHQVARQRRVATVLAVTSASVTVASPAAMPAKKLLGETWPGLRLFRLLLPMIVDRQGGDRQGAGMAGLSRYRYRQSPVTPYWRIGWIMARPASGQHIAITYRGQHTKATARARFFAC